MNLLAVFTAAVLLTAGPVRARAAEPAAAIFRVRSTADYGSGAKIQTDWYCAGGIPGIGAFAGHPNTLNRGDRVIARFNVSPLFLRPASEIPTQSAALRFRVNQVVGKADARRIEVVHLRYDPSALGGNDLVNAAADVVATIDVRREDCPGRVYTLDVSAGLRANLTRGDKYCAFRFRDVDAETRGNVDLAPTGAVIAFDEEGPTLQVSGAEPGR